MQSASHHNDRTSAGVVGRPTSHWRLRPKRSEKNVVDTAERSPPYRRRTFHQCPCAANRTHQVRPVQRPLDRSRWSSGGSHPVPLRVPVAKRRSAHRGQVDRLRTQRCQPESIGGIAQGRALYSRFARASRSRPGPVRPYPNPDGQAGLSHQTNQTAAIEHGRAALTAFGWSDQPRGEIITTTQTTASPRGSS